MNQPTYRFAVVILAAGASSRMGRSKLLLPWGPDTVIGHLLKQWQTLGATQIAVVCAPSNQALLDELDRYHFPADSRIFNSQPDRGMFSSIQCAANWNGWWRNLDHLAVALGDQPHVRLETLRRLIDFAAARPDKICQPSRKGHGRHPVFLPAALFSQTKDVREETLKQFLVKSRAELALCEIDDPGLDLDLDEPADYERALQLVAANV
jgi:molybdenum cofactor cytidylyltransferase